NLINLDTLSRSDGLEALRAQIDTIDDELLVLLEKRMRLTDEVGTIKASSDIAIADPAREAAILERLSGKAQTENAPLINDLYRTIFAHSKKRQEPR
ncbi:MAG: chorismate mutase, partial [Actinomycetia bacterium]|nr:chorismate mutase [Actinomycetes bacterium]